MAPNKVFMLWYLEVTDLLGFVGVDSPNIAPPPSHSISQSRKNVRMTFAYLPFQVTDEDPFREVNTSMI